MITSIGKKAIKAAALLGICAAAGAVASAAVCAAPLFITGSAVPIIAGSVLGAAVITVACKITKEIIAEKARKKFNKAIKAIIQEAKKDAVYVGIFDNDDNRIGEMTIESEQGVDASIKQGDVIYLYNDSSSVSVGIFSDFDEKKEEIIRNMQAIQEAKKDAIKEAIRNAPVPDVGIFSPLS